MSSIPPVQAFKIQYKPTNQSTQSEKHKAHYQSAIINSPIASELSAKGHLDELLSQSCPQNSKRLVIVSPDQKEIDYLVVRKNVGKLLKPQDDKPEMTPKLSVDTFTKKIGQLQNLEKAKELTIQHEDGQLVNGDALKSILAKSEEKSKAQVGLFKLRKSAEDKKQKAHFEEEKLHKKDPSKKLPQSPKPVYSKVFDDASSSEESGNLSADELDNLSGDEQPLMFDMEL